MQYHYYVAHKNEYIVKNRFHYYEHYVIHNTQAVCIIFIK